MKQTMKQTQFIVSEAGLNSLMGAGISIGWIRAWLLSAGATGVTIHLLESQAWADSSAETWIFFATKAELNAVAEPFIEHVRGTQIELDNPPRHALHFQMQTHQTLLLPIGEIAYQRKIWLAALNNDAPLSPLYIAASDDLPISLEPGLSASLTKPEQTSCLNTIGLILEENVINNLKQKRLSIRTVESCTAGGIAARLCRVPGSSDVVDRSWLTYSNQSKQEELDVDAEMIEEFGAVSQDVVIAMADGSADENHICIATSGIAGPGGGSEEKPVGTVWVAIAQDGQSTLSRCLKLEGARHEIQGRAVIQSLSLLLKKLEKSKA